MSDDSQARPTRADRVALGRRARERCPLVAHGDFTPASDRPDPVDLLEQQAATRVPDLVPLRYGRMLASPFAFFRGGALIMAHDLAARPHSGLQVQLCGDAHLSNFGLYGTPERRLVFDLNDFDETLPGPFEWDVLRLAASLEVAGRQNGFGARRCREIVGHAAGTYRRTMRRFADVSTLDVWYSHLDADSVVTELDGQLGSRSLRRAKELLSKARRKDQRQAVARLTKARDGRRQLVSEPPLVVRLDEMLDRAGSGQDHVFVLNHGAHPLVVHRANGDDEVAPGGHLVVPVPTDTPTPIRGWSLTAHPTTTGTA